MNRLAAILALGAAPALADPDPAALERLVRQDCGACHGMTLKGGMGPDIRPESLKHYRPAILKSVILDGVPGMPMPAWRPLLTEAEAAWIADYLLNGGTQ